LGIEMADLSPSRKQQINQENQLNIQQDAGIVIRGVTENSPAKRKGLLPGDVIQKVNGKPVKSSAQVQKLVESSKVGDIIAIEVNRSGKIQTFKVQSGAYPERK
jgi:S1-C subfamily serine protease